MQKRANRILSALIVLVMVLSMLPATVFATGEAASALEGWNIALGDDIGVKFHLSSADYTVTATVNGAAVTPTISDKVVTVNIAATQMTDTIGLTVKNGEEVVHIGEYSVRKYAETILEGEYDGYVKDMVKDMLNYGAAAQTYFDYNTDNLANAGYELDTSAEVPTEVSAVTAEDNLADISLYGATLVLRNKIAVRFYFEVTGDINSFTFSQGTPVKKGEMYYVEIDNINPQNLADDITLNVNDGALSVTYSPLKYIVRKYNNESSSAELKSLVQAMYGYHLEAKYYNSVVPVGSLQSSGNGWGSGGIYATMPENDAYFVQNDWGIEYTPVSADVIKLVRGDVTQSVGMPGQGTLIKFTANDYYLKTESWTIAGEVLPLVDQDYLIIEGRFQHPATGSVMYISKTYIYNNNGTLEFTTTEPVKPVSYDVGVLQASANGAGSSGIYFQTAEANDAPWGDWNTYYDSASVDNVKLIRNGETISVGLTDRNTICKFGQNDYYLRLETYTIGDYAPFTTDDVFIVEGAFTHKNSKTTLNIEKTYIYHNGASWVFANSLPTVYEAGVLQTHEAGMSGSGIYVRTAASDAPFNSDWSLEYEQTSADNIKIVRNGETVSVGIAGRPLLIKLNECDYYLKLEAWTIGDYAPITTDDMLIIEGDFFYAAENVTLNITKSYVYYDGTAWVCSAEEPAPEPDNITVSGGNLAEHADGWDAAGELFVSLTENALPVDENAEVEYTAQSGVIKLVRGENTSELTGTIVKYGATDYYMVLSGDALPLQNRDYLIVEGDFTNADNGYTLNVAKTYILVDGENLVYSTTEPDMSLIYDVGVLTAHTAVGSSTGFYANGLENDAPYSDWAAEYAPESKECIQIIRNGETIYRENTGAGAIIKLGGTGYYVKFDTWIDSANYPLQAGDIIIIEGIFVGTGNYAEAEGVKIKIDKTYVVYDGSSFTFSATEPVPETIYDVGVLTAHTAVGSSTGFYANGLENDAPYSDWAAEYAPESKECIQIIRNGETIYRENTGAGAIIKLGGTGYYVKFDTWIDSANYPLQAGDIIIIEGIFVGTGNYAEAEGVKIKIDKTYVVYTGNSFTFSETDPRVINVGPMSAQGGANWNSNVGINFAVKANTAPYDANWSVEYVPASSANIQLIRNGQTTNIANTGAGTIVKLSESNCYLKLEQWMISDVFPITEGDVLVVEGEFKQANGDYAMVIEKTYIVIGAVANDEVTFTTHYAETDFGTVVLPTTKDTMTIGMWNGSYHVFEDKQLQELKAAGITKIMGVNTQWIGTENVNAWLDRVYSYGISVIMDLRDWDGTTVPEYANHPGLIGFLMYDEPSTDVFDDLATLKAQFDAVMPADKLFYVNLFPECAADSSLGTETSWWDSILGDEKDYDTDYVTAFLNALNIEVLSWDNYSLITNSNNEAGVRTEYFHNFEVMAAKNLPMWYTMLSAGHTAGSSDTYYATPTAEELRWQMAVALTYGVRNIDHYVYASHEDGYSCMVEYETWEPTDLYYDIKDVDNEYLAWDHIFMAYNWQGVGVYDAGSTNTMLSVLENKLNLANYGLTVNSSNEDLLVGVFDNNGNKAYMVTNAGSAGSTTVGDGKNFTTADATVTLSLGSGSYKCVAVIDNGQISYVAVNADNTVTLNVQAYEGVFVIPVLN